MSIAKILVVDDDPDFCEICRMVLQPSDYEVVTAANANEARKRIDEEWPDIVLLDLVLSSPTDGLEFSQELHHDPFLRYLPVIIVISILDSQFADLVKPEDVPYIAAWLSKPISPERLIQVIGDVLEQSVRKSNDDCSSPNP